MCRVAVATADAAAAGTATDWFLRRPHGGRRRGFIQGLCFLGSRERGVITQVKLQFVSTKTSVAGKKMYRAKRTYVIIQIAIFIRR